MRRRVATEVNSLEREIHAERVARLKEIQAADQERMGTLTKMPRLAEKSAKGIQKADNTVLDNYLEGNELRKKSDEEVAKAKISGYSAMLSAISSFASESKELAVQMQ